MAAIKERLTKIAFTMAKPIIKGMLIKAIKDNQTLVINNIKSKVDIPKLSPDEETKLLVQIYDSVESAALLVIERL